MLIGPQHYQGSGGSPGQPEPRSQPYAESSPVLAVVALRTVLVNFSPFTSYSFRGTIFLVAKEQQLMQISNNREEGRPQADG